MLSQAPSPLKVLQTYSYMKAPSRWEGGCLCTETGGEAPVGSSFADVKTARSAAFGAHFVGARGFATLIHHLAAVKQKNKGSLHVEPRKRYHAARPWKVASQVNGLHFTAVNRESAGLTPSPPGRGRGGHLK